MGMDHEGRNKECPLSPIIEKREGGMIKVNRLGGHIWTKCNKDDFYDHFLTVTKDNGKRWCLPGNEL